ncbi:MAG: acyl-CoA/acyl-ACP dehydrogenase [Syntrophaceae bacterium]|nr:acyl-CoA/acyl-ACP dehydrogenase [Syntrophaceae bacterium]
MDFNLTEEQRDIQKAAREFAQGEFDPDLTIEMDQAGKFPESIWKKAARLGFIGIHYPEEYGGQGFGLFEAILTVEAFCRVDSGLGSALCSVDRGVEVILKFGSDGQKRNLLPPLAKGEKRLTVAFAESEDAWGLSLLAASAKREADGYLLQGEKRFVANGPLADTFLIVCREPKEGLINLIVDKVDGIEILPVEKVGLRTIPFGDLRLRGVRVPLEMRIGGEDEGSAQVLHFHQTMGLKSAAQALGMAQGAFDRAMQYAKQREQFGRRLSQFQVIRHKLADMVVSIEVSRWLTYKAAAEYDQGKNEGDSLSIAQIEAGRRLISVVDEALQIFGGYGYMAEQEIEHYYRDAWAIGAELGTEEEHKDEIARRALGGS